MRIDWDLSGRHTRAEVSWPQERLDAPTTSLEPIESVRIRLPAGKTLRMADHVRGIILDRKSNGPEPLPGAEGEIINHVEVASKPLSVEEVYRRALSYADQFDLPRAPLEGWHERRLAERGPGPGDFTDITATNNLDQTLGGEDGPVPNVGIAYSTNDERPWIVLLQLDWPRDL